MCFDCMVSTEACSCYTVIFFYHTLICAKLKHLWLNYYSALRPPVALLLLSGRPAHYSTTT